MKNDPICAVAGTDKKWGWAGAAIEGETVVVNSPQAAVPFAVRYAFTSNPAGAKFYNPAFKTLLTNAVKWAGGR